MSTTRITDNDYADVALYDKVNMIANEIDNEVSKKANSSNTVTTDTTQTITGGKTFTSDIKRIVDIDVTTAPTSTKYVIPFTVDNADQSLRAYQQVKQETNGKITYTLGLRRNVNGENKFNVIDLETDATGNTAVKVLNPPTSSNGQNVATTTWVRNQLSSSGNGLATFSKTQNGYYKFTNGLIIQWGYEASGEGVAITLPTPFTTTNYSVAATSVGNDSEQWARLVNTKTTTSFKMNVGGGASNYAWNWIAIGY